MTNTNEYNPNYIIYTHKARATIIFHLIVIEWKSKSGTQSVCKVCFLEFTDVILTCRQDAVALSLFGKLYAIFAPVDCGFWDARCSTGNDHWGQSGYNYLRGFIRYRWRNCGDTGLNTKEDFSNKMLT